MIPTHTTNKYNNYSRWNAVLIAGLLQQFECGEHHFVGGPFVFRLEIWYRYAWHMFGYAVAAAVVVMVVGWRKRHDGLRAPGFLTGHLNRDVLERYLFAVYVFHIVLKNKMVYDIYICVWFIIYAGKTQKPS